MPTKENVRAALDKIKRTADYDFFFENLKSAAWLEPLDELNQFSQPSAPLRDGNLVRYPFWPPARYLTRIAPEKPEKVMQVILKVPATDNPRVHEDFVEAALKMPPDVSVKLFERIQEWLMSPDSNLLLLSSKVADYITHIAQSGFLREALRVTNVLLGVKKYEKQWDEDGKTGFIKRADPIVRSDWEYNEALKTLAPSFHKQDKVNLVELLCEKLHQTILIEERENDREFRDLSCIWRGAVEDSDQNHEYGIKDTIINWIRDLSEEVLNEAPELIERLCEHFRAGTFPIFSRFGLHLARLSARPDLASKFILDQQLFDCLDVWHEYALLIEAAYPLLSMPEREKLLTMIAADVAYKGQEGREVSEEDNERSRYFYYYMLRGHLTGEPKEVFERLHAKFGDLEHPTYHSYSGGTWVGPTSPKSESDLKTLSIVELKKFLEEWRPAEKWFSPSIEGLGRTLESVIVERLDEFIEHLEEFKLEEKTYVRAVIQGLSKALAEKKTITWEPVLNFLVWASDKKDESEDNAFEPGEDKDPSWGWSRQAACRLLERGLASEENQVPFILREQAWKVLSSGLSDPHPKEGDEDKYTSNNNFYQTAINSVRGVAMEATVHYALWVKRNLGLSKEDLPVEKAPELFSAFDRHLDLSVERSKAVRSVYGRWMPWLLALNRNWFRSAKEQILPRDEALRGLWAAAWDANILFNQPYTNVFDELRDHYLLAIDRIEPSDDDNAEKSDQRLVDHLINLFLLGQFDLDSEFIVRLYSKLDARLKKRALDMIGRWLANEKYSPDSEIVKRAISFWNFRVEECRRQKEVSDRRELAEFGWWLRSGKFDDKWALEQTIDVLNLCHFITPDHMVMERLMNLVDRYPTLVAEVLRLMVDYRVTDYGFFGWLEDAKVLFSRLLKTEARDIATKAIHKLGAYGFNQFGDLLKDKINGR